MSCFGDPLPCRLTGDVTQTGRRKSQSRVDWDNDLLFRLTNRSRFEVIVRSRVSMWFNSSSAGYESIPCPALRLHLFWTSIQTGGVVPMIEVDSSKYRQGLSNKARQRDTLRTWLVNMISQYLVLLAWAHSTLTVSPAVLSRLNRMGIQSKPILVPSY